MTKLCTLVSVLTLSLLLVGSLATHAEAAVYTDDDRTGQFFLCPMIGLSIPVGALADANYDQVYASWRKEGISLTGAVGLYITNSSIVGLEMSYSTFNPRDLAIFRNDVDRSRVRVRRFGGYFQYLVVPNGRLRPFIKLGAGFFEIERISMPQPGTTPLNYRDYTLGAKPVMSGGVGVMANVNSLLSLQFSIEGVSLNSFSAAWDTEGQTLGPLRKNMLFFPVYASISYHFVN